MQAGRTFPTRLVNAARRASASEANQTLVDVMSLPSAIALGAPSRVTVAFEPDSGDRTQMRASAIRFGDSLVPLDEIDLPWVAHWLHTLASALGAEVRRRAERPAFRGTRAVLPGRSASHVVLGVDRHLQRAQVRN